VRAPGRRRRPASEDTAPIRDNPRGQKAGAIDQPARGARPGTGRWLLAGRLGTALLAAVARPGA